MWGLAQALSDTTNEALRSPSAEGLKVTITVNFCPARRVEPQRRAKKTISVDVCCAPLGTSAYGQQQLASRRSSNWRYCATPFSSPIRRWLNSIVHWVVRLESERFCARCKCRYLACATS